MPTLRGQGVPAQEVVTRAQRPRPAGSAIAAPAAPCRAARAPPAGPVRRLPAPGPLPQAPTRGDHTGHYPRRGPGPCQRHRRSDHVAAECGRSFPCCGRPQQCLASGHEEWGVSRHRNAGLPAPGGRAGTAACAGRRPGKHGPGMSKARLVITAVISSGRSQGEVARAYGVARSWIYTLLGPVPAEGEAAFEPRSRRPKSSPERSARIWPGWSSCSVRNSAGRAWMPGQTRSAGTCARHHQVKVSAATISRYLTRHGLVVPEPKQAPEVLLHPVRRPSLPNECGRQISPTGRSRTAPAPRSCPGWMTTPGRAAGDRPPPRHRPHRA